MHKLKFYFFIALLAFSLPVLAQVAPLNISLPQPMFVGTPSNFKVENLEEPLGAERPPFLVPAGTENVAHTKPVYSSYEPRKGELWRITDNYKEATSNSFVELGPGHQYITIDLEDLYTIYAVTIWHYHMSARVYHAIAVQVSDDPDFIMNVQTVFNNDLRSTLGLGVGEDFSYVETHEGKLIDAKGIIGRYVRLHSRGNTDNEFNHYIEVGVYGKAVN